MPTLNLDRTATATARNDTRTPWTLFAVTFAALLILAALLLARRPSEHAAAPTPSPSPSSAQLADPAISDAYSDGIGMGPTVWRDQAGAITTVVDGVRPYGTEAVWCKLTVGEKQVEAHASDGQPAICVWVRDAA